MEATPRRMSQSSKVTAPMESAKVSQAKEKMKVPVHWTGPQPRTRTMGKVVSAAAAYWIAVPVIRSPVPQKRF